MATLVGWWALRAPVRPDFFPAENLEIGDDAGALIAAGVRWWTPEPEAWEKLDACGGEGVFGCWSVAAAAAAGQPWIHGV